MLGQALKGRRDEVVLVSKVCTTWDPVTHTTKIDGRYSTIKRMCDESLQRLQTDHVDLMLVHWPDADTPLAETMRALDELRTEGKALHIGVSNYSAYELREGEGPARRSARTRSATTCSTGAGSTRCSRPPRSWASA